MKKTLLSLSLLSCTFFAQAQAPKHEWVRNMGGSLNTVGTSVAVDNLGNVYTAGTFDGTSDFDPNNLTAANLTSNGKEDIFITKFNSKGEYIWAKSIGGSGSDQVHQLKLDGAGSPYIIGSFEGTVDFDPSSSGTQNLVSEGAADIYVAKFDVMGNFLWAKGYGGPADDKGISLDIKSSDLAFTGYFTDTINFNPSIATAKHTSKGSADIFVTKLDLSGNYVWSKAIGGLSDEEGKSVSIDKSGNILLTGFFNGSVDFNPGLGDYFMAAKAARDGYVVKLNKTGDLVFSKVVGGNGFDAGQTILTDAGNNIYTVGYFTQPVDFDPSINDAFLNPGMSSSIFIQKLDSAGLYQWAKSFNATITGYSQSAGLDYLGNIYLTGYFSAPIDFGTGSGVSNLSSTGFDDIFIVKIYPSGKYASSNKIGGTKYENGFSLMMGSTGEMYGTGLFSGTVDFDAGVNVANLAASVAGISDAYTFKWSSFPSSVNELSLSNNALFSIYPNPNQGIFNIDLLENNVQSSIRIVNTFGQTVYQLNKPNSHNEISLSSLAPGMYFVSLTEEGQVVSTAKIIVQ